MTRGLIPLTCVVLVFGACVQILGDDFEVAGAPGAGGAATSTGGGTTTGMGATGGTPAAGPGGTASVGGMGGDGGAGMGGSGGTVGPGCDPYALGLCGANRKCTVVNFSTGDTDCIATTSRPVWSRCDDDSECIEGTFCSPLYGTCKPLCQTEAECPAGESASPRVCNDAWLEVNGTSIPGIKMCAANCNAATSAPCATPGATCNLTSIGPGLGGFDCVGSGNIPTGGPCDGEPDDDLRPDCSAGNGCFGNPQTQMGQCYRWCEPVGVQAGCPNGESCGDAGGWAYGYCR